MINELYLSHLILYMPVAIKSRKMVFRKLIFCDKKHKYIILTVLLFCLCLVSKMVIISSMLTVNKYIKIQLTFPIPFSQETLFVYPS